MPRTEVAIAQTELAPAVARKLEGYAKAIDRAQNQAKASIVEVGRLLKAAQLELANHGDGSFCRWIEFRCSMDHATAYRYMAVFDVFGREDFRSLRETSTQEALYFLARDTTPEEAIEAAVNLAEKGQRITLKTAKELVQQNGSGEDESDDTEPELSLADAMLAVSRAFNKIVERWP